MAGIDLRAMTQHLEFTSKQAVDVTAGYDASKLKGRSVVITGGASGIGEEVARQFLKAGAFVTVGDVSNENGNKLIAEIGEDNAAFVKCNVLTWSDQVNLFKTAIAKSPSKTIDIVVANAGISGLDTVWQNDAKGSDDEPIEPKLNVLQTNLTGVFYTAKLAVHYLSRNGEGNDRVLIMTASLAGYVDQPGSPQYNASKWGVRGLMHSLRRTMPGQGIRVNIIAPWFIRTPIMSAEVQQKITDRGIAFAEVADAGTAVLHMAADKSYNGRSCAVLPRSIESKGYVDLKLDDHEEGDYLTELEKSATTASHRVGTK